MMMDRDSITRTGARASGVERLTARMAAAQKSCAPSTQSEDDASHTRCEGRAQTAREGPV